MSRDPLDGPNTQGPKDRLPGAPRDRSLTHLGRQFDQVLGKGRTQGLPESYHLSSHWDDVDSFDERQPMRRNHGMVEGGSRPLGPPRTEGTRQIDGMDIVQPIVQKYGAGWQHALRRSPN